jgi:hypothetical protein
LEAADRGVCLGGKEAINWPWVKPEVSQMLFCDVDLSSAQEPVQSGAFNLYRFPYWGGS